MSQKNEILSLLKVHGAMTQGELAQAMYGDSLHTPNIYFALMSLMEDKLVLRSATRPAMYSLCGEPFSGQEENAGIHHSRFKNTEALRSSTKQKMVTMSAERAICLIRDYSQVTIKDAHGRYMSWQHCYKAFTENRNKTDPQTIDFLALHLAFYLASWGMYRGSSFLFQKDYKVHTPIVQMLQQEKYAPLQGISAENLCKASKLTLLEEISARIKTCYAEEKPSFEGVPNNATDTLVTKILLGTLGCVPAFDRYYVQAVKKHHISSGQYGSVSVHRIAKFYCDHLEEFEKLRRELSCCGVEYPPMKLMDMCFWQDAYIEDRQRR